MTKKLDIIVVDSDPSMMNSIRTILDNDSYSIAQFTKSSEALSYISNYPPKMILIDYNLHNPNASEFIVKMSQAYLFQYTSVYLLTEHPIDEFKKMQLMTLGFSKIFRKPINQQELCLIVEEICQSPKRQKNAA